MAYSTVWQKINVSVLQGTEMLESTVVTGVTIYDYFAENNEQVSESHVLILVSYWSKKCNNTAMKLLACLVKWFATMMGETWDFILYNSMKIIHSWY